MLDVTGLTDFVGYEADTAEGQVLAMVADGETVERGGGKTGRGVPQPHAFLRRVRGQIGDTGLIETETGSAVVSTPSMPCKVCTATAAVQDGYLAVGQQATATIDTPRREAIRKSHTGTHVHWALRDVLGDHASQAGSLVEPGRLRFDFSHFTQVAPQELAEVEARANEKLIDNQRVKTTVTSKEEAEEMGALAFFGDKYGDTVRVVQVGNSTGSAEAHTPTPRPR